MVAEVFGGISALKAAFDMTKTLADMSDAAKRDRLSINLQKEIFSAQSAQAELIEEVSALKAQLASFETWDAEQQRYELKAIAPTAVAYVLKAEAEEPNHRIGFAQTATRIVRNLFSNTFRMGLSAKIILKMYGAAAHARHRS